MKTVMRKIVSRVSPNVVRALVSAVRAFLEKAVFALYFVKTPRSAQKTH
jgi:hypothetical protein